MKKLVTALAATASALAAGVVTAPPAAAAVPSCSRPVVVAAQVTPHPLNLQYDFIDVATATATCVDLSTSFHTAQLVFEWYYDTTGFGDYAAMPSCPNTLPANPTVTWVGAVALAGTGACHRPPTSAAFEVGRMVCVDLRVDGVSYFGTPVPYGPGCTLVLLNPTAV